MEGYAGFQGPKAERAEREDKQSCLAAEHEFFALLVVEKVTWRTVLSWACRDIAASKFIEKEYVLICKKCAARARGIDKYV